MGQFTGMQCRIGLMRLTPQENRHSLGYFIRINNIIYALLYNFKVLVCSVRITDKHLNILTTELCTRAVSSSRSQIMKLFIP
jgi:hypothetical protein